MSSALTKIVKPKTGKSSMPLWMQRFVRRMKTKTFQIYFMAFMIPLIIMIIMCIANRIYPFGAKCFLRSDLYNQYMPFYADLQQKLKNGENFHYSWQLGLGSDFMAVYSYYLACPLNFLIVFVSTEHLIELMTVLIFIKIGACGLTSCYYLVHHFRMKRYSMVCFSVFYALSGFMAAYNWNIMWLDAILLAPLIILGLEEIVRAGKWKLYTVALALSIMINYYISIMICIFLVLYFVILILYIPWKQKLRSVVQFGFCSILAACMGAVIMLPGVAAIMGTGFSNADFPKTCQFYFNALDVLARQCVNVSVVINNDHWPNIYCGVAVLFLFPFYVSCRQIQWKKKIPMIILLAFFIASFSNNMLNFIWHGMNYPDSLPARQSFLYILVLLTISYEAFLHVREASVIHLAVCYVIACGFVGACMLFNKNTSDYENHAYILTLMFLTVYAVLGAAYKNMIVDYRLFLAMVILFVSFEAGINTFNTSISTVTRSKYLQKYTNNYDVAQDLDKNDPGLYRIELNNRMTKNDGPLSGFKTATLFSSTVTSGIQDFYQGMGMDYSKVYYSFDGATPLSSAMLGVKYLITDSTSDWSDPYHSFYKKIDDVNVYKGNSGLSIGYCVPAGLSDRWSYEGSNPIDVQNGLSSALGVKTSMYTVVTANTMGNVTTLETPESGDIYVQISGASKDHGDTINLTVKDSKGKKKRIKTYSDAKKGYLLDLGYCEAGDNVTLETTKGSMSEVIVYAYRVNDTAMKETLQKLGEDQLKITEYGSDYLKGTVSPKKDKDLVISVPYDKGWTILVDGKKQKVETFAGAFPMVALSAGSHQITMKYIPTGEYEGIALSAGGLAVFALLVYVGRKRNNRRRTYRR